MRIKLLANNIFGDKTLSIIEHVVSSKLLKTKNDKMTKRTADIVVAVAATVY
jgi:hypothetical protein